MKIHIYVRTNGDGKQEVRRVEIETGVNKTIKLPPKYLDLRRKTLYNPISECYIPLLPENTVYHYK
jgi:hypothetical protein